MTAPRLYFENALATISEHPDGYAIFTYRTSKRERSDLQAALTHTGNLLLLRRWHRILGDQRLMEAASAEENALIANYWQQQTQVLGHGICVASILAQDVFARLSATQLRGELKAVNVSYRVFDDEASANTWLRGQLTRPPLK